MFFLIVKWKIIYTLKDSTIYMIWIKKINDFEHNNGFNSNQ
jgi:hypothetical protein